MEEQKKYIPLQELNVYKLSRILSSKAWEIYENLTLEHKKLFGGQFLKAVDSIGANIAEGYARYQTMDQIHFYHYARGSMSEAINHWASLLLERKIISDIDHEFLYDKYKELEIKLNNFIAVTRKSIIK